MEAADTERRELLERCRGQVDGADRATGAGVDDCDDNGLLVLGYAHLAAAHGVSVKRARSGSRGRRRGRKEPAERDSAQWRYVLVGVRTRTREARDRRVIDGDDHVGR